MDNHTTEQRHRNMQAIKSKDSNIECILRKALWHKGYRYRKNYKKLAGKPDIVFLSHRVAIFCDSEFWHGYNYKETIDRIGTNKGYWEQKIKRNMERDIEVNRKLEDEGWRVIRFWGNDILKNTDACVDIIIKAYKERGITI